jgi:ATP-dependent protease Clp ATPase subunit
MRKGPPDRGLICSFCHNSQDVVGPDSLPRKLSLVVSEHNREQGKIVLLGPASGLKTRLVRMLAQVLHVPFAVVDATGCTPQP